MCTICSKRFTLTLSAVEARKERKVALTACSLCISSGAGSARWKGGHRQWSPGRFGKDKNGLSWKTQRRLAWERADNKCENPECPSGPLHRRPDVHHKVPYRISQSHALDNLICYCQSCHLTEEAKCQEAWGGQLVQRPTQTSNSHRTPKQRKELFPKCATCGESLNRKGPGRLKRPPCRCTREEAVKLRADGHSPKDIAAILDVAWRSVYTWTTPMRG